MNNYQLYRTNAKLGGQVAWNLVLEDVPGGDLVVSYFDLTPISPSVKYKYGQNRDCVRYSHQENLRTLYEEIKGQFYDAVIDPELMTIYPIIGGEDKDTRDSSLDMGCSRISYNRYGKQLQVFCPVWLEDFKKDDKLSFLISLYTYDKESGEENVLSSKQLVLGPTEYSTYHNRFVQYFNNYLEDISNEDGLIGDDVLNIDITGNFASIHGMDIKTGKLVSKDISNLVPNLYERERPLMETDFLLIDNFHTSTMVAKQLFNFNLVFNIADLVSNTMGNMLQDDEFLVKVDVSKVVTNDRGENELTKLEKRIFNNNYSSRKVPTSFEDVLKYLQDDKCIDNIRDNKLAPDICHWTLNDNSSYVFNVYPGYGTVYDMFYKGSPNYWEYDAGEYPNALNWINCSDYSSREGDIIDGLLNDVIEKPNFTTFSKSNSFFKYTRVDKNKLSGLDLVDEYLASYICGGTNEKIDEYITSLESHGMNKYVFIVPKNDEDNSENNDDKFNYYVSQYLSDNIEPLIDYSIYDHLDEAKENGFVILSFTQVEDHYVLIANKENQNRLSYKWMVDILPELRNFFLDAGVVNEADKTPIDTIVTMLDVVEMPKFIYLYNSLGLKRADSPWINTDEIYYVKVNNKSNIVIRYDGKIRPMFSKFDDMVLYRVRKMTPEEFVADPSFQTDQTQGFLPNYPSMGYFNLEIIDDESSDDSQHHYEYNEYKWFENSRVFNTMSKINTRVFSKSLPHYYTNEELIEKVLVETYPNLSSRYLSYLRSLYNAEVSYEYDDPAWNEDTHQFDYIYTINLELK